MSTLFLIGNGFDINCGMRTSYLDVYKSYVLTDSATDNIKKYKESISSDIATWGDFEIAMGKYAEKLDNETEFLECVRDFAEYMEEYLFNEQLQFKKKLQDKQIYNAIINEVQNSFSLFYTEISHNVDRLMERRNAGSFYNIQIISFNYTDVFDQVYHQCGKSLNIVSSEVLHIHSELKDGPVFGVDNDEQIKAKFTLSNKGRRGFIKPVFNEEYDKQRVVLAMRMINDANTICTYGMSLGESDLSWRNELIKWLRNDVNHHLFIYNYDLARASYKTVTQRMDIEEDEKEKMLSKWGISNEETIFNQIHLPCGKNIFNIKDIIHNVNREKMEKKAKELEIKMQLGKEYVERHAQDVVVV